MWVGPGWCGPAWYTNFCLTLGVASPEVAPLQQDGDKARPAQAKCLFCVPELAVPSRSPASRPNSPPPFSLPPFAQVNLSTRPEKYVGDQEIWERAEGALKSALEHKVGGWAGGRAQQQPWFHKVCAWADRQAGG